MRDKSIKNKSGVRKDGRKGMHNVSSKDKRPNRTNTNHAGKNCVAGSVRHSGRDDALRDLSYYGLYLLKYLKENRFALGTDYPFIRLRADEAADSYENARMEGYSPAGAHEIAMNTLMKGLQLSKYGILRDVIEGEFYNEVAEEKRDAFTEKLLSSIDNVFSVYDLADEAFPSSAAYDRLYTELTDAVAIYIEEYGV